MSVFFADIIAGAKSLADFDGTGAGSSLGLDDSRWSIWGNQSIEALYKKFQIWNPDLFNTSADFTLNLNEGVITPPADYRSFRGLTKWPDTNRKREIHKFNLGARDSQCDVHYRPAGKQLLLEPKLRSTGTYRLYYASGPVNLSTGDAPSTQQITDATAKVMLGNELVLTPYLYDGNVVYTPASGHVVRMAGTLAAGPGNVGWLPNGVEGPGKTLTAQFDAAITIDGLTPSLGDRVLVFQPNGSGAGPIGAPDYGVYQFTQIYTVPGHRYIVMRVGDYDEASEVTFGSSVLVSAGSTYAGQRFVLNTPDPIVVDETLLNFIPVGSPQLSIDGVNVTVGDHIFVNTQGEHSYDGLYDLSLFSDGLTQYWWFTRSSGQSAGTNRPCPHRRRDPGCHERKQDLAGRRKLDVGDHHDDLVEAPGGDRHALRARSGVARSPHRHARAWKGRGVHERAGRAPRRADAGAAGIRPVPRRWRRRHRSRRRAQPQPLPPPLPLVVDASR